MKIKAWTVLLISAYLTACASPGAEKYPTVMDGVTAEKVSRIIRSEVIPSAGEHHGEVISRVSSAFLGTPYQAGTLIGGPDTPEALVADFNGVDCFTLADYVGALTRSRDSCTTLPEPATSATKLTTSAVGTSSRTGSLPRRVMPVTPHRT